ncbi:MAG: Nif3-like dinuclear metal center hexameric protein [Bacteroidales bacterium]
MKLKELCSFLDSAIPLSYQEDYDNSGLQIGLPDRDLNSALLTLDITEDVMDEAIAKSCDAIISHHPLIFRPIKRISGESVTERIVAKAIKNNIAIYSAHTNLDSIKGGVSFRMAQKMGLVNVGVLAPLKNRLLKLVAFIPENYLEKIKDAVFEAGAGVTGNYDRCSFGIPGTGSFRPGENANPFVGKKGKIHFEREVRFETIMYSWMKEKVVEALLKVHPYEEPAYDIYMLENENAEAGLGCFGELAQPMETSIFLKHLAEVFSAKGLRYSGIKNNKISKVALCGGSGAFLLKEAVASGADAFVTADIKYHAFFDAENRILLVDIGHYEGEKFSVEILYDLIIKKFPTFALRFSEINTNPINYF